MSEIFGVIINVVMVLWGAILTMIPLLIYFELRRQGRDRQSDANKTIALLTRIINQ